MVKQSDGNVFLYQYTQIKDLSRIDNYLNWQDKAIISKFYQLLPSNITKES